MSPAQPPARLIEAAATVRRHPLRWSSGTDGGAPVGAVLERGWFGDPRECARVLHLIVEAETISAQAFGGEWPVLQASDWLVGPALPVPIGAEPVQGADGEYSRQRKMVWRETAGAAQPFLSFEDGGVPPGGPFDLLWFGDTERFAVRGGTLEIEDLFSVLRINADRALVERLLVRARRLNPKILQGIVFAESAPRAEIEVLRPTAATGSRAWGEATALLSARADVKSVERRGTEVIAETVTGDQAVFAEEATPGGWRLQLVEGPYVFTSFALEQGEHNVSLKATPDASIDPLAPGMRGRLAFDLRADLVTLD